jgi:hypothetical protein
MYNIVDDEKEEAQEVQDKQRKERLKAKVKSVGKVMRMYKVMW